MRHASVVSRGIAAGVLSLVSSVSGSIAAPGPDEGVPIKARVFFDRGDWVRDLGPAPPAEEARKLTMPAEPAPQAAKLIPVRAERAPSIAGRIGAPRAGLPDDLAMLSWAPTPPVPDLLSRPTEPAGRANAIPSDPNLPVLEDRRRKALEAMIERRKAKPLVHAAALERRKPLTEVGRLPLTRLSQEDMSTRWSDPLAQLEVDEEAARRTLPEFIMPFAGGRVTSLFNDGRRHPAIDLAGKLGSPVLSTTEGQTVVSASWRGGYGNAVITRDPTGRMHLYGHLKSITARVGQVLAQGDKLGHLGSTGRSTGPHVHYEVRTSQGVHINPVTVLFPGRQVRKGLAWVDVDQFAPATHVAVRVSTAVMRVARSEAVEVEPRRTRHKRKYRARPRTASYSQRSRRSWSYDDE